MNSPGFALLVAAALFVLQPAAAIAGAFEDGLAAAKKGDHKGAFALWLPVARQGDASAQLNLGLMHENGQGASKNYAKAAEWYHKAAAQGLARAQVRLGLMYNYGRGVPKDYAKATQWYRKAAVQGHARAQSSLGGSYGNGVGVTQDYVQAYMWLSLAAAQGLKAAAKDRKSIAQRMTPAQIEEAEALVRDWQPE